MTDNLCDLTIKSDAGQHSQFLGCFSVIMMISTIHFRFTEDMLPYWYNQMIGHKLGRTFQVRRLISLKWGWWIRWSLWWAWWWLDTRRPTFVILITIASRDHCNHNDHHDDHSCSAALKARVWCSSTPTFLSSANLIRDITQFST